MWVLVDLSTNLQPLQAKITENTLPTLSLTSIPHLPLLSPSIPYCPYDVTKLTRSLCVYPIPAPRYILHMLLPLCAPLYFIWIQAGFGPLVFHYPSYKQLMWSIVLLLPPSIHVQCPDAIIALSRVLMSLAPTHSTSTFPFLYLDFLRSPNTSHILVLKPTINTISFPWLAHNSVKFPISSTIEPLSCVACKHFSLLLWVYYDNYHPLSIHQYLNQKPSFPIPFKCSVYQVLPHYHIYSSHLLLCSKIN